MEEKIKDFLYDTLNYDKHLYYKSVSKSCFDIDKCEKHKKGDNKFDNSLLVRDYLIDGQEYYLVKNKYDMYDTLGFELWDFQIAILIPELNQYLIMIYSGGEYRG